MGIIEFVKANGGKNHKTSKWTIGKKITATVADTVFGYVEGKPYTVFIATKDFESKSKTSYQGGDWFAVED